MTRGTYKLMAFTSGCRFQRRTSEPRQAAELVKKKDDKVILTKAFKYIPRRSSILLRDALLARRVISYFAKIARPPSSSSLKITDRSFRYASHCLWNQLPLSLRQPYSGTSSSISYLPITSPITSSSSDSPLCTSITSSFFYDRLKSYLFHKFYPP